MNLQARNRKDAIELIYALKDNKNETQKYKREIELLIKQYELERTLDELIGRRRELQLLYERLEFEEKELRTEESTLQNVTRCGWAELNELLNDTEDAFDIDMLVMRVKFNYNDSFLNERDVINVHYSGYPRTNSVIWIEARVIEKKENVVSYSIRMDMRLSGALHSKITTIKVLDTVNIHIDVVLLSEDRVWYTYGTNSEENELDIGVALMSRKVMGGACLLSYDSNIQEGDEVKFDSEVMEVNEMIMRDDVYVDAVLINLKNLIKREESTSISVKFEISVSEHLYDYGSNTNDAISRTRADAIIKMWENKMKYEHKLESIMIMRNRINSEVNELTERVDAELVAQEQFVLSTIVQTIAQLERVVGDSPTYVRIEAKRESQNFTSYTFQRFIVRTNYSTVRESESNMMDGTSLRTFRVMDPGVRTRGVRETTIVTGNQLMDEIAFVQIYADTEVRVIARVRITTSANSGASGWITQLPSYRTPIYTADPLIHLAGGLVHRLRMNRIARGTDGKPTVIRMPVAPTRLTISVTGLYLMSNRSISYVIEAEAKVSFKMHVASSTIRINETLTESTELTVSGMRLFGVGADVDYVLTVDTDGAGTNGIYLSAEIGMSTLEGGVETWINANSNNNFSDTSLLNATGIAVSGIAPTSGGASYIPGDVEINVSMSADTLFRLGLIETGVLGLLNVGDTGKTWSKIDTTINDDDSNTEYMRRALFNEVSIEYEMRIQVPPVDLFVRRAVDEHMTIQNLINESLAAAISDLQQEVADVMDYVDYLSAQIDEFIRSQQESWWMIFVNATLEIGLGILIPGAGAIMAKGVRSMLNSAGTVRRIYNATVSAMKSAFSKARYTGSKSIASMSIAANEMWIEGALRATRRQKGEFVTPTRPMFQNGNIRGQKFDAAERIDVQSAYKFGVGSISNSSQDVKVRDRISLSNENMLPTLEVHTRPIMEVGALGSVIYDIANVNERMTRQYKGNITKIKGRQPGHAFMVYTDVEAKQGGGFIVTKRYLGVGELTVADVKPSMNSAIGGVRIKYEVMAIRTSDGKNLISPLGFAESGYTSEQVDLLFATLFNGEVNGITLPTDMKWEMLTRRVEQKILNSDKVSSEILTTGHGGSMLDEILNNPPTRPYNLLTKNCQHFVRDVSTVLRGLPPASSFDTNIYGAMSRARTMTIINDLGMSEAFLEIVKKAMIKSKGEDVRVARKLISNAK
nr:VP2 protein [Hubei lepidoptera virus 3]